MLFWTKSSVYGYVWKFENSVATYRGNNLSCVAIIHTYNIMYCDGVREKIKVDDAIV